MKVRILTALVLAPISIWLTLVLPTQWFGAVILALILLGLFEWNQLTIRSSALFSLAALVLALATWWLVVYPDVLLVLCLLASIFWVVQIFSLRRYGLTGSTRSNSPTAFFFGVLCLTGVWSALVLLQQQPGYGPIATVALLFVVWSADSCAYFAGKAFGQNKLAPNISPNKTVEGVAGGMAGACICSGLFGFFALDLGMPGIWLWMGAGFVAASFSVVGDLYESRLKRLAGVKDSGNLLPGHGGVLDRIDGLIAAAPVFVALWLWNLLYHIP